MSHVDLIIIIIFIAGILMGYRRGFILQVVHLLGFFAAYIVAYRYFKEFAIVLQDWIPYPFMDQETGTTEPPFWMQMFDMESMFYSAIAFAALFFGTKLALQVIGHVLHTVALLPGLNMANRWLGAALGFLEVLIILFIIAHVLVFIPWETGQIWMSQSKIALWLLEQAPYFSGQLQELWSAR
jgi:uncharacterized membrane protein required for colicin V production